MSSIMELTNQQGNKTLVEVSSLGYMIANGGELGFYTAFCIAYDMGGGTKVEPLQVFIKRCKEEGFTASCIKDFEDEELDLTPVIFRWLEGHVIAFFPTLPGTSDSDTCLTYMRVGQHGAAFVNMIDELPLGLFEEVEVKDLASELEKRGYNLQIFARYNKKFDEMRLQELGSL